MILCRPAQRDFAKYVKSRDDRMAVHRHERCYFPLNNAVPVKAMNGGREGETTKEGHHEVIAQ